MTSDQFFEALKTQYTNKLPFVAYCKPNAFEVKALLQKDDNLYKVTDFSENGFVFSPFDLRKDVILLPFSKSKSLRLDTETLSHEEFIPLDDKNTSQKQDHIKLVSKAIDEIRNTSLQKVVVSRAESQPISEFDFISSFIRMVNINNLAFVYCWYHPKVGLWLGATPETLFRVNENRLFTMALAGTQPYEGVLDVIWKDKEREEQRIVRDYICNQLKGKVSDIEVSEVQTIRAGSILHLKNDISAQLNADEVNLKQIIYALHPTPAICGLPKIEAMQFIVDNENYNREFYTGFLGELNYESTDDQLRNSELYVNLRCMQVKNETILIYVGGGITEDSLPEKEWTETVNKSKTLKSIIAI